MSAKGSNRKGIRGICDNASLSCVNWQFLQKDRIISHMIEYIAAFNAIIDDGAKVINCSFGNCYYSEDKFFKVKENEEDFLISVLNGFLKSDELDYEIYHQYLINCNEQENTILIYYINSLIKEKKECIFVQSAGNGINNGEVGVEAWWSGYFCGIQSGINRGKYDSLYTKEELEKINSRVIVVGSIENSFDGTSFEMSKFSNYGNDITICAPGGSGAHDDYGANIFCVSEGGYGYSAGTSQAAPIVTGVCGLIWSLDLSLTSEQVKDIVVNSAKYTAIDTDKNNREYPIVNAYNSVKGIIGDNESFEEVGIVYAGNSITSIIDAQNNLLISGDNKHGQLGSTVPSQKSTYSLVASGIKFVCGSSSLAAITNDNRLLTWGYNGNGQLGYGLSNEDSPILTPIACDIIDVSITESVCAYVTSEGELYAMGIPRGSFGDDANTRWSSKPIKIMDDIKHVELSSNVDYGTTFAAINNDDELYMWGGNSGGMITLDKTEEIKKPTKVMDNIMSISLGNGYTLALTKNRELYAWGKNNLGQLGIGNIDEITEMVKVMDNVIYADAGGSVSLAISENGELFTWGINSYGCLGQGLDSESKNNFVEVPTKIMGDVQAASVDGATMIMLTKGGDVYTCGWNSRGQLGTGNTEDSNIPIWVYNVYDIEGTIESENVEIVDESYFDEMENTKINVTGEGQNLMVDMSIDHLEDFIKYNGGKIRLRLSDGNVALQFVYAVEDDKAAAEEVVYVLTENRGSLMWNGAGWHDIACEQKEDVLSWRCLLPSGSFSIENLKFIEADIYTSRSREHITTYQLSDTEKECLGGISITQMDVAVPSIEGYHQYIE